MSIPQEQEPYKVHATLTGSRATIVPAEGGPSDMVTAAEGGDTRMTVIESLARRAFEIRRPIELTTSGDRGSHSFVIRGDGSVTASDLPVPEPHPIPPRPSAVPNLPAFEPVPSTQAEPMTRRQKRESFLATAEEQTATVTDGGWRAVAAALGFKPKPSDAALQRAEDRRIVSQHWPGCHKIAVVNVKGGQGKTPTTANIAAAFARFGGGMVLAWDNSETLGTLGWRTESGMYDTSVRDLLTAADSLLQRDAEQSEIARYVHHQTKDMYQVLRSSPALFGGQSRITADDFDSLVKVAERFYRLVVFDSGKDESGDRWLRMLDTTHQLIIPVLADLESAESVRRLLEELHDRDEHSSRLASNAVVLVSEWPQPVDKSNLKAVVEGLSEMAKAVEVLPFDPALKNGPLRFDSLRPQTQDVYVRTAAHAARGMTA